MKNSLLLIVTLFTSFHSFSQDSLQINGEIEVIDSIITLSPEDLVQQQLNGYNTQDIEAFIAPYSDSVELYTFPNTLKTKGKEKIKKDYIRMFKGLPNLHCEIVDRIINGNMVIDHERITGLPGDRTVEVVAIYVIENDKIQKVYFPKSVNVEQK